jgi:hypothetical protein
MALTPEQIAAFTADIANLNTAIGSGVRSATVGGQTITYATIDALIKARNDLLAQLTAGDPAQTRRPRQTYAVYGGRGFH